MERKVFSVVQISRYIKRLLQDDVILNGIFVRGEISNFKSHTSGHLYFTLKDAEAQINCVMFKTYAELMPFKLKDGMQAIVYGGVSLYEKSGQYQLYAELIEPSGVGSLTLAFEQLKTKLLSMGLFDDEHKKEIPRFPKRVGIVTSETGAAVHDIITVAQRRNKAVKLVLCPAQVQGEKAAESIASAIYLLNREKACDVIIVGRGGGSIEDLWAFNEEKVARAIYNSKIPIVSAVGHETDVTIADFVADLRAPTPSAAAEICVPSLEAQKSLVGTLTNELNTAIEEIINDYKQTLEATGCKRALKTIVETIYNEQIYVLNLTKQLNKEMKARLNEKRQELSAQASLLESLSPLNVIGRGYALCRDEKGNVLQTACEAKASHFINIQFSDGCVNAVLTE